MVTSETNDGETSRKLTFRDDFRIWDDELERGGAIAGSIQADKYVMIPPRLRAPITAAIEGLRGGLAPSAIEQRLHEEGWELDVEELVGLLASKQLVSPDVRCLNRLACESRTIRPNDEVSAFSRTLLRFDVRKPRIRPEQMRHVMALFVLTIITLLLADLTAVASSSRAREVVAQTVRGGRSFGAMAWSVNTAGVVVLALCSFGIHEAGHVLVARRYGLFLRSVQFRFYRIFQSFIAVQIPGLCTLPLRAQVEVALAGPLANLAFGLTLGTLLLFLQMPSTLVPLLMVGAVSNVLGGISNMNPFLPTDGYRFFSIVLFRNSDIRSRVVAQVRTGGMRSLRGLHRAYFYAYVVSTVAFLGGSNFVLVSLCCRVAGRFLPQWALAGLLVVAIAFVDWSVVRRTVRFFKG